MIYSSYNFYFKYHFSSGIDFPFSLDIFINWWTKFFPTVFRWKFLLFEYDLSRKLSDFYELIVNCLE